ncbi:MAG: hypothetical protein IJ539_06410 [Prevotella sp.]|nr:hypothetical protein [Prevotella sp.]
MNRLIFTLMLLATAIGAKADRWTKPSQYEYPDETVLYIGLIDPSIGTTPEIHFGDFELAAFIDGECREVVKEQLHDPLAFAGDCFRLRVRGNAKDMGKEITFKLFNAGFVYNFTTTYQFDGESHGTPGLPVPLPCQMISGVGIEDPIVVEQGSTIDLHDKAWLFYGVNSLTTNTVSPIDEEETPIVFDWRNNWDFHYEIGEDGFSLTGTELTSEENEAYIRVSVLNDWMPLDAWANVIVVEKIVPLESISCDVTEMHTYINDDFIAQVQPHVIFLPEDATNKNFKVEELVDDDKKLFSGNTPFGSGETTICLVSKENPSLKTDNIKVYIQRRPDHIRAKSSTINVPMGGDIMAALIDNIVFEPTWADDIDKTLILDYKGPSIFDKNYIADHYGQGIFTVRAAAQLPDFWTGEVDELEITVIVKTPVTGLEASETEAYVQVGDNVYDKLKTIVHVVPEDATFKNLTFEPQTDGFIDSKGVALKEGDLVVTVASEDDPSYSVDIKVVIMGHLFFTLKDVTVSKFGTADVTITASTTIDGKRVQLVPDEHSNMGWGEVATVERLDDTGLKWRFHGRYFGSYEYGVTYDGSVGKKDANTVARAKLVIPVEYEYVQGWNWLSLPIVTFTNTAVNIGTSTTPDFLEVRSFDAETYRDPELGFFGDLTKMEPEGGAYKVYATKAGRLNLGTGDLIHVLNTVTVRPGYNWLTNPHEIDHKLSLLGGLATFAQKGDLIVGRDMFAEYDGNEWVGPDGFTIRAGQGYLYYNNVDFAHDITWGSTNMSPDAEDDDDESLARQAYPVHPWNFDSTRYPDNFTIVAALNGIDDTEGYTVGAFVGGECRGYGMPAGKKYIFITVYGKVGEKVSFQLLDSRTGRHYDISNQLSFGLLAGSLSHPVVLAADIDGIGSTIFTDEATDEYFDVFGRKVSGGQQGVTIRRTADGKYRKVIRK